MRRGSKCQPVKVRTRTHSLTDWLQSWLRQIVFVLLFPSFKLNISKPLQSQNTNAKHWSVTFGVWQVNFETSNVYLATAGVQCTSIKMHKERWWTQCPPDISKKLLRNHGKLMKNPVKRELAVDSSRLKIEDTSKVAKKMMEKDRHISMLSSQNDYFTVIAMCLE